MHAAEKSPTQPLFISLLFKIQTQQRLPIHFCTAVSYSSEIHSSSATISAVLPMPTKQSSSTSTCACLPPLQECKRFVREHCREGSNPDYPWMQQIFTTLVTWRQLEQYLFPRLRDVWKKTPFRKPAPLDPNRNVFLREVCVYVCVCRIHTYHIYRVQ